MRGIGGITQAIADLLATVGIELSPWMAPAFGLGLMLLLLPLILKNLRTGQARKLLRRAWLAEAAERRRIEDQALRLVEKDAPGLVAIAEEALRQGRRDLARQALARLEATGKERKQLRRLRRVLDPDELPPTLDAFVLLVERLIESGLRVEARRRLEQGQLKFGPHPELSQLEARVASPEMASEAS